MESAFEVDGPHYFTVLALHILPPEKWRAIRVEILRRLLVTSHARAVAPGGATRSVSAAALVRGFCLVCVLRGLLLPGWSLTGPSQSLHTKSSWATSGPGLLFPAHPLEASMDGSRGEAGDSGSRQGWLSLAGLGTNQVRAAWGPALLRGKRVMAPSSAPFCVLGLS